MNNGVEVLKEEYELKGKTKIRQRRILICKCKKCNNLWKSDSSHTINGSKCPYCSKNSRVSENEFYEICKKNNLTPIGEYNFSTDLVKVMFEGGYYGKTSYSYLKNGWFPRIFSSKNEFTIDNIRKYIENENRHYDLISKEYISKNSKLEFKCKKHNILFKMSLESFRNGCDCPACAKEKVSGENSYLWRGGSSGISNALRASIFNWRSKSFKKYNNKCDICKRVADVVHHKHKFELILQEAMDDLCFCSKKNMSEYTEEEILLLKNKILILHEKYGLGVALCSSHHNEFHRIYGVKKCNENDYINFKILKMEESMNNRDMLKELFFKAGFSNEVSASILANIEAECNFIPISESLKYSSVERIKKVFYSKIKNLSDDEIEKLVLNEKALGNIVYKDLAKEKINGKTIQHNGYDFRGRGFIQITGVENYKFYGNLIKEDLVSNPDLACNPDIAGRIAIEYVKNVAFKNFKDLNSSKDLCYVADCITKSIQGISKDYSKGFLLEHLVKKRKLALKQYNY